MVVVPQSNVYTCVHTYTCLYFLLFSFLILLVRHLFLILFGVVVRTILILRVGHHILRLCSLPSAFFLPSRLPSLSLSLFLRLTTSSSCSALPSSASRSCHCRAEASYYLSVAAAASSILRISSSVITHTLLSGSAGARAPRPSLSCINSLLPIVLCRSQSMIRYLSRVSIYTLLS